MFAIRLVAIFYLQKRLVFYADSDVFLAMSLHCNAKDAKLNLKLILLRKYANVQSEPLKQLVAYHVSPVIHSAKHAQVHHNMNARVVQQIKIESSSNRQTISFNVFAILLPIQNQPMAV